MSAERRHEAVLAIVLFTVSAATSVLLNAGVVCSNDGSHYALVRALADHHTVSIDQVFSYTGEIDYSQKDNHYYSDRPPGTALLALPFYLAARSVGAGDSMRQVACGWLSAIAGGLCVVLTFFIGLRLGLSCPAAGFTALTLALCTPLRTYSSSLWSHAPSACLVAAAALLALPPRGSAEPRPSWLRHLSLGLVGGYAVVVDYSSVVASAVILGAVTLFEWKRTRHDGYATLACRLAPLAAGFLVGIAPALVYHTVAFGSPFRTAYNYHVGHPDTVNLGRMYGGSFLEGLVGLLFSWRAGLLLYSPILALALGMTPRFVRSIGVRRAALVVLPWIAMMLLTFKHSTWDGGAARDARYLLLIVPLLCLPLATLFDSLRAAATRGRTWPLALLWLTFFVSAAIQIVKHQAGWVRHMDPSLAELARIKSGPVVVRFLTAAFPHPLTALAVLGAGLATAALVARSKRVFPGVRRVSRLP